MITTFLRISIFSIIYLTFNLTTFGQESIHVELVIDGSTDACSSKILTLTSNIKGRSNTWYRNGQVLIQNNEKTFTVNNAGEYWVVVETDNASVESKKIIISECNKSEEKSGSGVPEVNLSIPTITSPSPVICGTATSATLTASYNDPTFQYQWYYSTSYSGTYTAVSGATTSTVTVSNVGYYKVFVNDNVTIPGLSNPFEIRSFPILKITDALGNTGNINVSAGVSTPLKLVVDGPSGPFVFKIYEGMNIKSYEASTSPFEFNVSTNFNERVGINSFSGSCGTNYSSQGLGLIVNPSVGFALQSPTMSACPGSIIEIPYTTTGTWPTQRQMYVNIFDKLTGNYISGTSYVYSNPIEINLPSTLVPGREYYVDVVSIYPLVSGSPQRITILATNSGCTQKPTISVSPSNESCSQVYLNAFPVVNGNIYEWYKDNVLIPGQVNSFYTAESSGSYTVKIVNNTTGYNATSSSHIISIIGTSPIISSPNTALCGSNTQSTISSNITSLANSYQWYISTNNGNSFSPLVGQTSPQITTSNLGTYRLKMVSGSCETISNQLSITSTSSMRLSTVGGQTNSITVNAGTTVQMQVSLNGAPPFMYQYSDGINTFNRYTNSNFDLINFSPMQSTVFYVYNLSSGCGLGNNQNGSTSILVNVSTLPSLSMQAPSNSTVCKGGRITIPITRIGTWGSKNSFSVELTDINGNYISNSGQSVIPNTTSFDYNINTNIPEGSYFLRVYSNAPNIGYPFVSSYSISVVAPCTLPSAKIYVDTNGCTSPYFKASPEGAGLTYKWYRNNILISTTNYSGINLYTAAGNYYVEISNSSGYNSTSPTISVNNTFASSTFNGTASASFCNSGANMTANEIISGNTYQWYYSQTNFGFSAIAGATNATQTTTGSGVYKVITKNGNCERVDEFRCNILLNYSPTTICRGSTMQVPIVFYKYGPFTLQLVNASDGQVVVNNLLTENVNYIEKTFLVNIPPTVQEGTYKISLVSENPSNITTGVNTITISSGMSPPAPNIILTPAAITSSQVINISVTGCSGNLIWSNGLSGNNLNIYASPGEIFSVFCQDLSLGCISASVSDTLLYNCSDTYENNNTFQTAKTILGDSFTSSAMCFSFKGDEDWFKFVINGQQYFARIKMYSTYNSLSGSYLFKKTYVNGILELETLGLSLNDNIDTEIILYNEFGTEINYDDESGNGNFSKLTHSFISNPCASNLVLTSPIFDIHQGETSRVRSFNNIIASNLNLDQVKSSYEAQNFIQLLPGFETKITTEGYFKAEILNCN